MQTKTTLLALAVGLTVLAGCGKQEGADPATGTPPPAAGDGAAIDAASAPADGTVDAPAADAAPAAAEAVAPAAPEAKAFDLQAIPVSTATLPAWPYLQLPAGYEFDDADRLGERTKDLARIPVWTGDQLLWVEGRVFSDDIDNIDGKTFSRFELAKGLRQQVESLGGVRLTERGYDRETYKASEKALDDFRQEFDDLQDAYWYDKDVDTYAIRRADGVVWVVLQTRNEDAAVLVAEGPAPTAD